MVKKVMFVLFAFYLILLLIFFIRRNAHADSTGTAPTYKQSCTQVTISNSTPTELTGNLSNPRAFVWAVKVSNLDSTANLCCNQDPAVSCSIGAHHGEVIAPVSAAPFNFLAWVINTTQPWYCLSSGAGSTNAQVCLTQ